MSGFADAQAAKTAVMFLADATLKGAAFLLAARVATVGVWRLSAAARHGVWTLAVMLALAVPVGSVLLPRWKVAVLPPPQPAVSPNDGATPSFAEPVVSRRLMPPPRRVAGAAMPAVVDASVTAKTSETILPTATPPVAPSLEVRPRLTRMQWLLGAWTLGTVVAMLSLITSRVALWRIERRATQFDDADIVEAVRGGCEKLGVGRRVRLLKCHRSTMPMTWGVFHPRLLMPMESVGWPVDQLTAVVLHELAHVKRWDCATQTLAQLLCTFYWFNPLTWLATRRMKIERELACDDIVVAGGSEPANYAENLVAVAKSLRWGFVAEASGVSMARRSNLKRRLLSILDSGANRSGLSWRAALVAIVFASMLALPVATMRLARKSGSAAVAAAPRSSQQLPSTRPASRMALKVLDADGKPLTGIALTVHWDETESSLITDKDGGADIALPVPEVNYFGIDAHRGGFVPKRVQWSHWETKKLPAEYTLRLQRGVKIGGKVIDDAGKGVGGAHVDLWIRKELADGHEVIGESTSVISAADGTWTFDNAPAEEKCIHAGAWDYRYANGGGFDMAFPSLADLRGGNVVLKLHAGQPVRGRVIGPDDKPIAGAMVLYGGEVTSNRVPGQQTDASGRFAFAAGRGERVVLTVVAKGCALELNDFIMDDKPHDVTIQMSKSTPMTGTVVDPAGKGIAGTTIIPDTWRGFRSMESVFRTGKDGKFTWRNAPTDTVYCNVSAGGYLGEERIPLTAGADNKVTLRRCVHINGTVVDDETGKPIDDFAVVPGFSSDGKEGVFWNERAVKHKTHTGGNFELTELRAWQGYAVRIEVSGYASEESRLIKPEETEASVSIRMKRGSSGKLVAIKQPDGKPAVGAMALAAYEGHAALAVNGHHFQDVYNEHSTADEKGMLTFGTPPNTYVLAVIHDSGYAEIDSMTLSRATEVKLKPWAHVHGQLRIGNRPAAGKDVTVYFEDYMADHKRPHVMQDLRNTTDADGRFQFDRVPPGKFVVAREVLMKTGEGFSLGERTQGVHKEAEPGQTLELTIGGMGRAVVGKLAMPAEMKSIKGWSYGPFCDFASTEWRPATPELPENVKNASQQEQQKWWAQYSKTEAGKAYYAALSAGMRNARRYAIELERDGSFRIEDVAAGSYGLTIMITKPGGKDRPVGEQVAYGTAKVVVPEMPGGRSDEPLVIPDVPIEMIKESAK